jgi:hypothetical protein
MSTYSTKLAQAVKEYLEGEGWTYTFDDENGKFRFKLKVESTIQSVETFVNVREKTILVYGYPALGCDMKAADDVATYFSYANYGLPHGNFEIDLTDGEVRYKSSVFCGTDVPCKEVIEFIVDLPSRMWTKYGNGFVAVNLTGADPKDEVDKADA